MGIVRRIDSFAHFLLNYEAVVSDAAVPTRTVREYFSVLLDRLIAEVLEPYRGGTKRKAISTGKLYFSDIGVANALRGSFAIEPETASLGKALEHFVYTELCAWLLYTRDTRPLHLWPTTHGIDVDFVIGDDIALAVKSTADPVDRHLKGLRAIGDEREFAYRILVFDGKTGATPCLIDGIEVVPVVLFLRRL